jgi:hypothetical protein
VDYHYEVRMPKKLKPVHPGEILHEGFMAPLGLSMNKMAMDLSVPVTRIADIVISSMSCGHGAPASRGTSRTRLRFGMNLETHTT